MRLIRAIACITIVCCSTVRAQTLVERVPSDAIAYIGWKGADSPDTGYANSHLQAVIDASGFARIRDEVVPQLMQKAMAGSKDHGEAALAAKTTSNILWRHPTAFFFAGTTKDPNGKDMPKLGVICRAERDSDALMTIFNAGVHGPDAAPMARAFTTGDLTVFLVGYSDDNALPPAGTALQTNPYFSGFADDSVKSAMLCGYLDMSKALAAIDVAVDAQPDEQVKSGWQKARDASGLAGIKRLAYTAGFDGRDWQSQCFVDAPAPRTGLLTVVEPAPIDAELLARVPGTAPSSAIWQFNFGALITQSRAIAAAVDPSAGEMFDKGMGALQMMIGRNLQRDILGPLGSQWAIYSDPSIPSPAVSTTQPTLKGGNLIVVNKLVDPARALQGWTAFWYAINNMMGRYVQQNHLQISMATTKNGNDSVFTMVTPFAQPSWTISKGYMYFGLSPAGVVAAANRDSGTPVTQQPAFVALAKQLNPGGAINGFEYADLQATAPEMYRGFEAGMSAVRKLAEQQSVTIPERILPPLEKLLPELSPAMSLSWSDASGWHSRSRSPFPGSAFLSSQAGTDSVAGVALGTSILLPSLNRARETANRVKCASNERQIGQACLLWCNDNKGKYPGGFADMLTEEISPEVFLCPSSNTSLPADYKTMSPADIGKWITEHGDYVYFGAGMTVNAAAEQIVLYEKPGNHDNEGLNVLFADGHVEFLRMADAVKMITEQNKTVPTVKLPGAE